MGLLLTHLTPEDSIRNIAYEMIRQKSEQQGNSASLKSFSSAPFEPLSTRSISGSNSDLHPLSHGLNLDSLKPLELISNEIEKVFSTKSQKQLQPKQGISVELSKKQTASTSGSISFRRSNQSEQVKNNRLNNNAQKEIAEKQSKTRKPEPSSKSPFRKICPPKSEAEIGNAVGSTSTKSLTKSKSKTKKLLKTMSSRDILNEVLGDGAIVENNHTVDISASFKYRPDFTATFIYNYNPTTKMESFKTNCGRDKLAKMEMPLDKNGNPDASQFIKSLAKLSSKYEGTINLNNYKITTDSDPSRRLKITSLDIRSSPMIVQLSPKGIKGITVLRSTTKLKVHGETEFEGDDDKTILFEGQNCVGMKIYSPEGKGKLFVCIPTSVAAENAENIAPVITTSEENGVLTNAVTA